MRPSPALVVPVPSPLARPETPTSGLGAPASSPRARVRPGARTRLSSGASRDATPGPEPTRGFPEAHRDSHRTVSPPPPPPPTPRLTCSPRKPKQPTRPNLSQKSARSAAANPWASNSTPRNRPSRVYNPRSTPRVPSARPRPSAARAPRMTCARSKIGSSRAAPRATIVATPSIGTSPNSTRYTRRSARWRRTTRRCVRTSRRRERRRTPPRRLSGNSNGRSSSRTRSSTTYRRR